MSCYPKDPLARVLEMQRDARDEFLAGAPHAWLGIADTVMEEVLILTEASSLPQGDKR